MFLDILAQTTQPAHGSAMIYWLWGAGGLLAVDWLVGGWKWLQGLDSVRASFWLVLGMVCRLSLAGVLAAALGGLNQISGPGGAVLVGLSFGFIADRLMQNWPGTQLGESS